MERGDPVFDNASQAEEEHPQTEKDKECGKRNQESGKAKKKGMTAMLCSLALMLSLSLSRSRTLALSTPHHSVCKSFWVTHPFDLEPDALCFISHLLPSSRLQMNKWYLWE